jgi:CRISPR type IV-associated protein Csf3
VRREKRVPDGLEPLIVTAHTPAGYTRSDPWSPSLDGILAYWALRERVGDEEFALGSTGQIPVVDIDLPLGREEWNGLWWWQCSSPVEGPLSQVFARHIHRRFDDQNERYLDERVKTVVTKGGPYKVARLRREVRLVPWVRWHVVGNAAEIQRLLRRCTTIGRGSARGSGEVAMWEIHEGDEETYFRARFRRPLPVGFAEEQGVTGLVSRYGIRPPARAPERQMECVLP